MFIFTLEFKVPAEKRPDVVNTLRDSLIAPTNAQSGCIQYGLSSDTGNDDRLFLFAVWETQAALERHIHSDVFRIVLSVMEVAVEEPKINFHCVSFSEGMEFVERVRI